MERRGHRSPLKNREKPSEKFGRWESSNQAGVKTEEPM